MIDFLSIMAHVGSLPAPCGLLPFSSFIITKHSFWDIGRKLNSGILIKLIDTDGEVDLEQKKLPRFEKIKIKWSVMPFLLSKYLQMSFSK